LYLSN